MIKPTEADIGRKVIYRERGDFLGRKIEEGVLTSFNEKYAFVRYAGVTSAATNFEDLDWVHPTPRARPSYNLTQERYEQAWREKQRLR